MCTLTIQKRRSCSSSQCIWAAITTGSGSSGALRGSPGMCTRIACPTTRPQSASGTNGTGQSRQAASDCFESPMCFSKYYQARAKNPDKLGKRCKVLHSKVQSGIVTTFGLLPLCCIRFWQASQFALGIIRGTSVCMPCSTLD